MNGQLRDNTISSNINQSEILTVYKRKYLQLANVYLNHILAVGCMAVGCSIFLGQFTITIVKMYYPSLKQKRSFSLF